VIWSFVSRFDLCRRAGALVLLTLATVAYGCGSSGKTEASRQSESNVGKTPDERLKSEDLYRYEGTGKEKRKVAISRRERVKLLHEAAKNPESK